MQRKSSSQEEETQKMKGLEFKGTKEDLLEKKKDLVKQYWSFDKKQDPSTSKNHYDQLATKYEYIVHNICGYNDPYVMTERIKAHISSKQAEIVEFGCGTGYVGKLLNKEGFRNLRGVDGSNEMMKQIEPDLYEELSQGLIGVDPLREDYLSRFDVCFATGCFFSGHFPKQAIDVMISAVKPFSGLVMFTVRNIYLDPDHEGGKEMGYTERLEELKKQGKLEIVEEFAYLKYQGISNEEFGEDCGEQPATCMVLRRLE